MDETCKDYMNLDEESLVSLGEATDEEKPIVHTTFQNHKKIAAQNKQILATEHKCMKFVAHHEWNHKVCKACTQIPKIKWRHYKGIWYRWYKGGWHYWGASKYGFKKGGWVWRKKYWFHNGYAYKYIEGKGWYRFYQKKWHWYKKTLPLNPAKPLHPPQCFYISKMVHGGVPDALRQHKVARCIIGGKTYLWEGHWKCNNAGGKKAYRKFHRCHDGTTPKFKRVKHCMRPLVIHQGKGVFAHEAKTAKAAAAKSKKAAAAKAAKAGARKMLVSTNCKTQVSGMK